jgi:hypothetical protein
MFATSVAVARLIVSQVEIPIAVIGHCQTIRQEFMLAVIEVKSMSDLDDIKLQEENALSLRVRTLCQLYGGSAENVGSGEFAADEEMGQYEVTRYEKGRKEALEIAIKLTDEFYRDAALHAALDYCMKAKDLQFATIIAKAITVDMIQEQIVEEYREYFVLNERDGRLHPTAAAALGPLLK